jgi:hypothetical protein
MDGTTMAKMTQETLIELAGRESIALGRLRGYAVSCSSGELWLTIDGEGRDIILGPGEHHRVASDAPAVVSAFTASTLRVSAASPRSSWSARCRAALVSLRPPSSVPFLR